MAAIVGRFGFARFTRSATESPPWLGTAMVESFECTMMAPSGISMGTGLRTVLDLLVLRGAAGAGPVTKLIMDRFFGLFEGRTQDDWGWLEPVNAQAQETGHDNAVAV